ncbi:zinc-ribbon domain-containing protein [candidate division WOR-3 bacterium]|nr:zinc-ribbon domain-containing protein [candidate division WOR-3 bacterium]
MMIVAVIAAVLVALIVVTVVLVLARRSGTARSKICPYCNARIQSGDRYCNNCGAHLKDE